MLFWLLDNPGKLSQWIIAALFTYFFFDWLDSNASPQAKAAIADWLDPRARVLADRLGATANNRSAVARAIRELFDRIYTMPILTVAILAVLRRTPLRQTLLFRTLLHRTAPDRHYVQRSGDPYWAPLLSWRAFWRSALITLVATLILTYVIFKSPDKGVHNAFLSGVLINILFDYLALYVIRMWLVADDVSAWKALFGAPGAGILLVISFMGLRMFAFLAIDPGSCHLFEPAPGVCDRAGTDADGASYLARWDIVAVQNMLPPLSSLQFPGGLAACLVHLWLPLFALCVGILKFSYFVLRTFNVVQWFLGRDHQLKAIGVIATPLVAVAVLLLQLLAAALSFS
jgi:hypothetical protein